MKILKYIFTAFLLLIIPNITFAADNAPKYRVGLIVVSADESIKGRVTSYMSRELRALGDVVQTKDNYEYDITVLAMTVSTKGGHESGFAISVNIHEIFDNKFISFMFKDENKKDGIQWTNGLYYYPKHWLRVGSLGDLQSVSREIITDFDSRILQKRRDSYQKLLDTMNKKK